MVRDREGEAKGSAAEDTSMVRGDCTMEGGGGCKKDM